MLNPTSRELSGLRLGAVAAFLGAHVLGGCAAGWRPPAPDVALRAKQAGSYSGELRLSLTGPDVRARASVLVGFRRPDALRIEVPGPTGARLVAVAREGRFVAAFPHDRAYFDGSATSEVLESLFGVALAPAEVMDVIVGVSSPRLRAYKADWGPALPRRVEATLPDGARLKLDTVDAQLDAQVPSEAFDAPAHDGYKRISAAEARTLWH
jgi:hypothetical protein